MILANLGGPDSLVAVRPFLFNLFYDRAILRVPNPFRFLLALFLSFVRNKKSKNIYLLMGGKSPILENTVDQAKKLKESLEKDFNALVIPVMRYWNPRAKEALEKVKAFDPDRIVFLPLYPQFSTTTTLSSLREWQDVASKWKNKTRLKCCYFYEPNFIHAHQELIKPFLEKALLYGVPRILFSAHGLPQKVIDSGDPYQRQTEVTAARIMSVFDVIDYVVCYQSRVGPLKWIGPSIDEELQRAAKDRRAVVVVPISFVSEHSETIVELDIDYAQKAKDYGLAFYGRVPTLGCHPSFIKCLESIVRDLVKDSAHGLDCLGRSCPLI